MADDSKASNDSMASNNGGAQQDSMQQDSSRVHGGSGGEDSDMLDALEALGLDRDVSKWVVGAVQQDSKTDQDIRSKIMESWDRLKLYGKGVKAVRL